MTYFSRAEQFKAQILNNLEHLTNQQLNLTLGNVNLLANNNILKSSTALGYIIEEYIFQCLTNLKRETNAIKKSYDFYTMLKHELFYVNVKAYQKTNNAVAAVNLLYKDYAEFKPKTKKHFLILKVKYHLVENAIVFDDFSAFYLEEYLFDINYLTTDIRIYSKKQKMTASRLTIKKDAPKTAHPSYAKTKTAIKQLYDKLNL